MGYVKIGKTDDWETPQYLFDLLNDEFHFTLDVCASEKNAKVKNYYTKERDGLSQDWTGHTVWCNPPYGREMPLWIEKCYKHFIGGGCCSNAYPFQDGHKGFSQMDPSLCRNKVH